MKKDSIQIREALVICVCLKGSVPPQNRGLPFTRPSQPKKGTRRRQPFGWSFGLKMAALYRLTFWALVALAWAEEDVTLPLLGWIFRL